MLKVDFLFFTGAIIIALTAFRRGRYIISALSLIAGITWVIYFRPVAQVMKSIGIDSISEAQKFDWVDAYFLVDSFARSITPHMRVHYFVAYLALACLIYFILAFLMKRMNVRTSSDVYISTFISAALICTSLYLFYKNTIGMLESTSNVYLKVSSNFDNPAPQVTLARKGPAVVVYIGESTTAMNMSLYGYHRLTTPNLDKLAAHDSNMLVFKKVFSTHTHTSPSLMEAFSVGINENDNRVPIDERKRVSIIDILTAASVNSYLFSNQGQSGNWNYASTIVFRHAIRTFSTNNRLFGNNEHLMEKPLDHLFFEKHLTPALDEVSKTGRGIVFLHSVAGHGPYLYYVSNEFKTPVDASIANMNPKAVAGAATNAVEKIDNYDSAVRYVDYSITASLSTVKARSEPFVFLYFSDHGEVVYGHGGHSSHQYSHEMSRIPFIMYFNDAARKEYPELFEKYQELSKTGAISTLAQLPATLFDVLGLSTDAIPISQSKVIGLRTRGPSAPSMSEGLRTV